MMRVALIACVFISCLCAALAEDKFVTKFYATPLDPDKPEDNSIQIIRYSIKIPANFQPHGPVFYGTAGRVPLEDLKTNYQLFEKSIPNFDNAAIVFAEQRFFGQSTMNETNLPTTDNLIPLRFKATINDHVLLIKDLSAQLNTKNFLAFGAGHGGLIAGYLANIFATTYAKTNIKVLAWASSPPLKFLRQGTDFSGDDFQLLNKQVAQILINDGGCDTSTIGKFGVFFKAIRDLTDAAGNTNNAQLQALNLNPKPLSKGTAATDTVKNIMKEFLVVLRNGIRDLTYGNRFYKLDGTKVTDADNKLKKLCDIMKPITTNPFAVQADNISDVLSLILPGYQKTGGTPSIWRISPSEANKQLIRRDAMLAAYQDCSELQLVSCSKANDANDPFLNTAWDDTVDCTTLTFYEMSQRAECNGLFGTATKSFEPSVYTLNPTDYPRALKKNVIVTMNKNSMFYGSYSKFDKTENDEKNFAWHTDLNGVDNLEFEAPKKCDTAKMNDVRYLALRAFGCFGNFIDNSNGICDSNLFNDDANNKDKKPYDDTKPTADTCPVDDTVAFPFGHTKVAFVDPENPIAKQTQSTPSTPSSSSSSKGTTVKPPAKTTSKKSNNAAGSLIPMMSVLLSTMFIWFIAFSLH